MIAATFSMLIGLAGIITFVFQLKNITALKSWKTTNGKIVERGTFRITHATRSAPAFQFAPLVKYVYQVEGKEFSNDAILPKHIQNPKHSAIEWARSESAKFPDDVTVYYKPENPGESFLVQPSKTTFIIFLTICIFIFSISAIVLLARLIK